MAFVPGDGKLRGPLFEGLPTLEDHRGISPMAAYLDLVQHGYVEKVLVGDLTLSEETLEQFAAYQEGVVLLRALAESEEKAWIEPLASIQTNRQDAARDCIRSRESREYGLIGTRPVPVFNTIERLPGSITIDNERYGRYQGEVQITKRHLSQDEKVNVIGRVIQEDIPLLQYVTGGIKFRIQWNK